MIEAVVDYCRGLQLGQRRALWRHGGKSRCGQGHGPIKIRFELRRKGLDDNQIDAAFEQPELDWFELALDLFGTASQRGRPCRFQAADEVAQIPAGTRLYPGAGTLCVERLTGRDL
ncbi:RecX family transcriptional regulator [Aeromonas hydrophila]|uniref:Regulatory protein RecX n=1 Tax=Aeromonas hydrophila TaxID=644 RepID=A0A926IXX7_AERHY|nr:RecX family transcriptional regulator [Aeromonas hydrophila]